MNGRMRQSAVLLLALWMAALFAVRAAETDASMANANASANAASVWADVLAGSAAEREARYLELTIDTADWQAGDVLSREPFVVVTESGARNSDAAAKVRIWTGWLARVGDDLRTVWDEIWIGRDGGVILAVANMETTIPGYFQSPGQSVYRGLEYAGRYPWVSIPTDAEAAAADQPRIPSSGTVNVYGLEPEGEADLVAAPSVASLPAVPDRVRPRRVFRETEVAQVPVDIERHWAREDILDLMRKGIVAGYVDGTIRPQNTLTRSEFLVLLMRGLQIVPGGSGEASSYVDVKGNWAGAAIAEAERLGIIPKGDGKAAFRPNEPLSRLEMAEWIAAALSLIDRTEEGPPVAFKDIGGLSADRRKAIQKAVNHGILKGFDDGTFRPDRTLTRAEAFVITSRLAAL